ncbi:MAG: hypothetical protein RLZZ427_926 [Pseudomonadota bacterium]
MFHPFKSAARAAASAAIAIAAAALPSAAWAAGSSSGSGGSALTVNSVCEVKGSTMDLGTYLTSQTWSNVGSELGIWISGLNLRPGARGLEYLNYGSVTCSSGTNYTLTIVGTSTNAPQAIKIVVNNKEMTMYQAIKKFDGAVLADSDPSLTNAGRILKGRSLTGTGTSLPQVLLGSVILVPNADGTGAQPSDKLTTTGVFSDTLTYSLSF